MKKVLLLAVMALVAMTSSARIVNDNVQKVANGKMLFSKTMMQQKASSFMNVDAAPAANGASTRAAGDVVNLVEIATDWLADEDETNIKACASVTITKSGETVDYNGGKYEKVTIDGMIAGASSNIAGYMNETNLVIPAQKTTVAGAEDYGEMVFQGYYWNQQTDEEYNMEEDVVLTLVDGVYEAPEHFYGFILQMTGSYSQYWWTSAAYPAYAPANGISVWENYTGAWEKQGSNVYVEQGDDNDIYVFGFHGESLCVMYVDEESGSVLVPNMQVMAATSSSVVEAGYGPAYYLYNYGPDGIESESEYIEAEFADDKTIIFPNMTGIFTLIDEEGRGYYKGYQRNMAIQLTEGTFPTAIDVIKSNEKKDNAIYNIAGQRVEKAQKGLYIMGGQKVLVK